MENFRLFTPTFARVGHERGAIDEVDFDGNHSLLRAHYFHHFNKNSLIQDNPESKNKGYKQEYVTYKYHPPNPEFAKFRFHLLWFT